MSRTFILPLAIVMATIDLGSANSQNDVSAAGGSVSVSATEIGGVVRSSAGPEAGVWVIAETRDLGTRFAKMGVTDDRGRYLIPDLPKAKYRV